MDNTEFNTKKIWKGEPFPVETIVGTTTVNGISIPSISTQSNITDNNKEAFPNSYVYISADSNGIRFSWTGYNGKSYTTDTAAWAADPTGNHTIEAKDYIDLTKYPELTGVNFKFSYSALSDAKVSDLVSAFNGRYFLSYSTTPEKVF